MDFTGGTTTGLYAGFNPGLYPGLYPDLYPGLYPELYPGLYPALYPGLYPGFLSISTVVWLLKIVEFIHQYGGDLVVGLVGADGYVGVVLGGGDGDLVVGLGV